MTRAPRSPKAAPLCSGLRLLTPGNPKTVKGRSRGYVTFILHLAPARLSGFQVCPKATAGCIAACLNTAGRGGMARGSGRLTHAEIASGLRTNSVQAARIRRTRLYFENRDSFLNDLIHDVRKGIAWARKRKLTPVFRLNGTSDIRWESVRIGNSPNIFSMFPDVQFYDYTKIANRRGLPANYSLTFSLADGNDAAAVQALRNGINVAAVFRDKATVARYEAQGMAFRGERPSDGLPRAVPVHNGDETDLRFLDPRGVVVALYAKGNAKGDRSGFVRD